MSGFLFCFFFVFFCFCYMNAIVFFYGNEWKKIRLYRFFLSIFLGDFRYSKRKTKKIVAKYN